MYIKAAIPTQSVVLQSLQRVDYQDSFQTALPEGKTVTITDATRAFFECAPTWVTALMKGRDKLVKAIGLKTHSTTGEIPDFSKVSFQAGEQYGLFEIMERTENEVIMGADDSHLNFRVSIHIDRATPQPMLSLSTIVMIHNRLGASYFKLIGPFHKLVVKSFLKRMVARLAA